MPTNFLNIGNVFSFYAEYKNLMLSHGQNAFKVSKFKVVKTKKKEVSILAFPNILFFG